MPEIVWSSAVVDAVARALVFGVSVTGLYGARFVAFWMMRASRWPWRTVAGAVLVVLVIVAAVAGRRAVQELVDPGDPIRGGAAYEPVGVISRQAAVTGALTVLLVLGVAVGEGL